MALLASIAERMFGAELPSPYPEAETLVRHFSSMSRVELFVGDRRVSAASRRSIERVLKRRLKGEPLSHLLKSRDFRGLSFYVNKDVLIPRPETEILVEQALSLLESKYKARRPDVLDLCTGSGCIAISLTLAYPECTMTALELSQKALSVARKNSVHHKLGKKISFVKSDLFSAVKGRKWDLIVSNPPYVPSEDIAGLSREVRSEPRVALDGGREGLEIIRRILEQAPSYLQSNGRLLMEIGLGQSGPVRRMLERSGWAGEVRVVKDLNGIDRVLTVRKNG